MSHQVLELVHVDLGYGEEKICQGISTRFRPGEFTAIIGPNGCGKSTVLKALGRTLKPMAGKILLDGEELGNLRAKQVAQRIGILPQHPITPESMRVKDLVARGRHPYHSLFRQWLPGDREIIDEAMQATGIAGMAEDLVVELSGGQRQRAWIAMVLAQHTDYVLLDEPTSFLDIAYQLDVLELARDVARSGRAVVAVLHDLNQAAHYADRLVVMQEGKIVAQGSPAEVLSPTLLAEVFGIDAQFVPDPHPQVLIRGRSAGMRA